MVLTCSLCCECCRSHEATLDEETLFNLGLGQRKRKQPAKFMEEVTKQDMVKKRNRADNKKAKKMSITRKLPLTGKATPDETVSGNKKPSAAKKAIGKSTSVMNKRKTTAGKSAVGAASIKATGVAAKKKRKAKEEASVELAVAEATEEKPLEPNSMALYERHRREFERILLRLEKIDKFGFFLDEAPVELDETLTEEEKKTKLEEQKSSLVAPSPRSAAAILTKEATCNGQQSGAGEAPSFPALPPVFPSHPPCNWYMVRRRMELGRYVVDREKREENTRFEEFGAFYDSKGKKRPRRKSFEPVSRKPFARPNPRVRNPLGVHWKLFLDDVVGMCDAALAEDEGEDDSRGSLVQATRKIKEVRASFLVLVFCLFFDRSNLLFSGCCQSLRGHRKEAGQ